VEDGKKQRYEVTEGKDVGKCRRADFP